jgi:hypothetical protein
MTTFGNPLGTTADPGAAAAALAGLVDVATPKAR